MEAIANFRTGLVSAIPENLRSLSDIRVRASLFAEVGLIPITDHDRAFDDLGEAATRIFPYS